VFVGKANGTLSGPRRSYEDVHPNVESGSIAI
jgi:hypothetical protein